MPRRERSLESLQRRKACFRAETGAGERGRLWLAAATEAKELMMVKQSSSSKACWQQRMLKPSEEARKVISFISPLGFAPWLEVEEDEFGSDAVSSIEKGEDNNRAMARN